MGTIHRKRDGAGGFFMRFFEVPSGKASANEHHEEQHCFRNTGRDILRFICVAERAW